MIETSGERLEEVQHEHHASVVREWNRQGIKEAYLPDASPDSGPVLVDGYEIPEGSETPKSRDSSHAQSPVSMPGPSRNNTWKPGDD